MPSDYDSGDGRRRPPGRPPEGSPHDEARDGDYDPGQRPPKRPPESEAEGRFEDPWFVDPEPVDESRRPPRRAREAGDDPYLPPDYDDYADYGAPRREEPKTRSRTLPVIIALLALGGFAGLLWYAYSWGVGGVESEDLPVVAAESSPAKVAPEEPGGMEIPNQDKQVLNDQGGEGASDVERLLPPPEEPQPPQITDQPAPEAPTEQSPTQQGGQGEAEAGSPPAAPQAPEPAPEPEAAPEPAPEPAPETATAQNSGETEPEPAPAPQQPEQLSDAPAGSFVMQLASVRSEETARSEWQRMQGANEQLLGDMPLFIQRVELEGRGTYYRIQTGPFPSRSTAQDLCAQLKAAGQDCLVTQR